MLKLDSLEKHERYPDGDTNLPREKYAEAITLRVVDQPDFTLEGNSPFLEMRLTIDNPERFGFFEQGKRYRCTIEPL